MKILPLVLLAGVTSTAPYLIAMSALSSSALPLSPAYSTPLVQHGPKPGEAAPELACSTPDGQPLAWKDFEGRAVILYFHASRTSNAKKAIDQLSESLTGAPDLKEHCTVLLIVDEPDAGLAAREALSSTGFQVEIGISKKHELFKTYGVVAFPTLYVVDGKAHVVDSVRGYGTLFSFHALTACRYALGMIDLETFERLLHGVRQPPSSEKLTKSRRYVMARRLLSIGKDEEALAILVDYASELPPNPGRIALVAHLQLLTGDAPAAKPWIEKLVELQPDALETTLLQSRLELAAGSPDRARGLLRGLDATNPKVEYVRGLILEQEQRFEDAAALYRSALNNTLFLPE